MIAWWTDVVRKRRHQATHAGHQARPLCARMILFIASEVMFFVAWFWAYFRGRLFPTRTTAFCLPAAGHWPGSRPSTLAPTAGRWHAAAADLGHDGHLVASRVQTGDAGRDLGPSITILLGLLFTTLQAYYIRTPPSSASGDAWDQLPRFLLIVAGFLTRPGRAVIVYGSTPMAPASRIRRLVGISSTCVAVPVRALHACRYFLGRAGGGAGTATSSTWCGPVALSPPSHVWAPTTVTPPPPIWIAPRRTVPCCGEGKLFRAS